jgi:hypothetical protein
MRPQKRSRGRNGGGNPYHNNNPNRGGGGGGPRPPHRSQTFDSNGPNVKIRGNAYQVYERYLALAREAQSSGDSIASENFYQHAEHYFRVMNVQGEGFQGQPRPQHQMPGDGEMSNGEGEQPDIEQPPGQDHRPHDHRPQEARPQEHRPHEQQAHVQIQTAPPPPPPVEDDDELPPFITGRSD